VTFWIEGKRDLQQKKLGTIGTKKQNDEKQWGTNTNFPRKS